MKKRRFGGIGVLGRCFWCCGHGAHGMGHESSDSWSRQIAVELDGKDSPRHAWLSSDQLSVRRSAGTEGRWWRPKGAHGSKTEAWGPTQELRIVFTKLHQDRARREAAAANATREDFGTLDGSRSLAGCPCNLLRALTTLPEPRTGERQYLRIATEVGPLRFFSLAVAGISMQLHPDNRWPES